MIHIFTNVLFIKIMIVKLGQLMIIILCIHILPYRQADNKIIMNNDNVLNSHYIPNNQNNP